MTQSPTHKPAQRAPDFKARFGVVPDTPPPKLTRLQQRKQKRGRFTLGAIVFSLLLGSAGSAAFFIAKDMKSYTALLGGAPDMPAAAEEKVAEAPPVAPINKSTTAESPVLLPDPAPVVAAVAAAAPEAEPAPIVESPPAAVATPVVEPVSLPAPQPPPEPVVVAASPPAPVVVVEAPEVEQVTDATETETVEAAANAVAPQPLAESVPEPEAEPDAEPQVAMAVPVVVVPAPAEATPVAKAGSAISLVAGQVFRDCENCPDVVVVVPPKRAIGADEVQVTLKAEMPAVAPFAIGRFEVTFDDWGRCMAGGGCSDIPNDEGWGRNARPVINVSHEMATSQYLTWLSKMTGANYRLPTAAEWDFAEAGAGAIVVSSVTLIDAQTVCQSGNYANSGSAAAGEAACADGFPTTAPAGSLKPNGLGLSDMRGNVWEWVDDCWSPGFKYKPKPSEQDCHKRLLRGGSWSSRALLSAKPAAGFEAVSRTSKTIGFRVARTLP